jgi:hypothetical protein
LSCPTRPFDDGNAVIVDCHEDAVQGHGHSHRLIISGLSLEHQQLESATALGRDGIFAIANTSSLHCSWIWFCPGSSHGCLQDCPSGRSRPDPSERLEIEFSPRRCSSPSTKTLMSQEMANGFVKTLRSTLRTSATTWLHFRPKDGTA